MANYFRKNYIAGITVAIIYLFGGSSAMCGKKKEAASIDEHLISLPSRAQIVDLTQTLNDSVPTYDGKAEEFKYQTLSTVAKDGYGSGAFFCHEHLGTHMDAPIHFSPGGTTIDKIDAADLLLHAVVIDVRDEVKNNPDYLLTVEKIKQFEQKNVISARSAVLLLTGWSERYFKDGQYRNADSKGVMHFPGFSLEAAKYLLASHRVVALGIDTLSIDYGPSEVFSVHKFVLSKGFFMVENLANLDKLPSTGVVVIFAPLKIQDGTGSPARVLALVAE